MSELVETANWGMRKRHYVLAETMEAEVKGRSGYPLCSNNYRTWDQVYHIYSRATWATSPAPQIPSLPLCTRCERKAASLKEEK